MLATNTRYMSAHASPSQDIESTSVLSHVFHLLTDPYVKNSCSVPHGFGAVSQIGWVSHRVQKPYCPLEYLLVFGAVSQLRVFENEMWDKVYYGEERWEIYHKSHACRHWRCIEQSLIFLETLFNLYGWGADLCKC